MVVTLVGDEIRIRSMTGAMSELQADAARFLQDEQTSVDAFLSERHAEAALRQVSRGHLQPRSQAVRVTGSVLDASALLAYLRKEPGGERVLEAIVAGGAVMTTVNFAEVATWFTRNGADEAFVRSLRARLVFPLVPVDDDLAIRAALLVPLTRSVGLSLGDRLCLSLAARLKAPALTADRHWHEVAQVAGMSVELIR